VYTEPIIFYLYTKKFVKIRGMSLLLQNRIRLKLQKTQTF